MSQSLEAAALRRTIKPSARANALLQAARARSRKSGRKVTITVEQITAAIAHGYCEVTGVPFNMEKRGHPLAPSLDRRDSTGDYTPENVRVVTWFYNRAKNTLTDAEALGYMKDIVGL